MSAVGAMNGVSLPPIARATTSGGSRPSSSSSTASTSYTIVPRVYYTQHNVYKRAANANPVPRAPSRLPALHQNNHHRGRAHPLYEVRSRFSAKYRRASGVECRLSANSPFLPKTGTEDCLKCLMKVPHKKCESHKYIRIGGGYRHGYWYVKCLLEEIELQRQRELIKQRRLEAIKENKVRAIKTYIRTKSGRLVEKIVFLSEEDYEAFKAGKDVKDILNKYLSKDEAKGLQSWDKDEVKAIKTLVRTKSGRIIEKLVYVSKEDYDAIKEGKKDAKEILKNYVNAEDGEVEGWEEAKMKTIKTFVRTKSGRLIEKTIMISQEDYDAMIKDGKDPNDIIKKYIKMEDGEQLESWQSAEPMKAIKTMIRTKSGRLIEKTLMVSADDYDKMMKAEGNPNDILKKYMTEEDGEIESWEKAPDGRPMKVVKTTIRTKSGRLIEKTVLMTEDEFKEFQASGGNPEFLKRFIDLEQGEEIEDWEKASTVYSAASDDEIKKAKPGQRIVGKDGAVYEVVVDPITGKKYKKKLNQNESDVDSGIASMKRGRGRKKKGGAGGLDGEYEEETPVERSRRKVGKRNEDSDSEYSYKSYKSDGGTRHVTRRRKRADGTYSAAESYHSDQDEEGQARRRRRRRERDHANSAHSYYSVVSEGGTRHTRRRKKRADGTYSASESYHSSDSDLPGGGLAAKNKKKNRREHGSDSDHSYYSEVSVGGTHHRKRKKKIKDKDGKVIGYAASEPYSSDDESVYTEVSDGKGGKIRVKKANPKSKGGKDGKQGKGKGGGKGGKGGKGNRRASSAIFSDDSTISDDVDLENMTEEEKKKYFEEKAARKAAREQRRREKYGDKYDEMVAANEKRKKDKAERAKRGSMGGDGKKPKSMVSYEKGSRRDVVDPIRKEGAKNATGGGKKKGKRDGNEADDESDDEELDATGKKKKKGKHRPKSGESEYEYEYDDKGRITKKKRKNLVDGESGSEYEYEYDADGNLKAVKKLDSAEKERRKKDDGDYFEVDEAGMVKLKAGRKKIDISRLTADALKKLGIDPNASKEEIARKLKEMFGDDILITDKEKKIGTKHLADYGSDVDTDELANDSDLDISELTGTRRVNVLMRRGGQEIIDHMKKVLELSKLRDDYAKDLDEREGDIDFLSHYRLVDTGKLESYARAFVVEDNDRDIVLSNTESRIALGGVPSLQDITPKEMEYVLKVLKIDDASQITFRMFAVISALSERVTKMDPLSKHLLEICDLLDIQRKMDLYRSMFYCNANSDRDPNYIKCESLKIELIAGGLNWKQQQFIVDRLQPNYLNEISFLDYICYIPLFLSMHENICDNPLDMSDNKYESMIRKPSGGPRQRDMNPLGYPLKKDSSFQMKQQAKDLLTGKVSIEDVKNEKRNLLQRYAKLPQLIENEPERMSRESVRSSFDPRSAKSPNKQFIDEDGNVYIMTKDPKTGKLVKKLLNKKQTKKKGPAKKANMTKEEKTKYKAGKRNEDSDSDYSYRSVYTPGGTRHVHRRKRNADGTYGSDESYHSSQDEDGEARRRRRRRDREHEGSAHSYYSVTSPGGTRQVRRKKRHADGTYSDSESCKSSEGLEKSKTSEEMDRESDYSINSEVSDGGTRTVTKKRRIRDEQGNIIGYGDPEPVDPEAMLVSDTGSISPRRGSISDGSEGAYDRYMADKLQQLDDIADVMDADKELEKEKEEIEKRKREEMNRLKERVFDPTWAGTKPTDKPDIAIPNFDDQIKRKDKRGASREKMGGSRGGKTGPLTSQDLANMTEEERVKYFEEQEKKKQEEKERQRKEKEKREKKEKLNLRRELTQENIEKERERLLTQEGQNRRRESVMSQRLATPNGKPQSMVTYEKGTGRDINTPIQKSDNRQTGLSHSDWARKPKDLKGSNRKQRDSTSFDYQPAKLNTLNRKFGSDKKQDETSGLLKKDNNKLSDLKEDDKNHNDNKENDENTKGEMHKFDFDENGNIRLKPGQKLDLNKLTDEDLIKLGIDPSLPKSELLKKLREKLGQDITIMEGDKEILDENCERDEDSLSFIMEREKQLAKSRDITGVRRVNLLLRHGGSRLQVHMQNIVDSSNMNDYNYATDLDERDSTIDYMCHYRLVNPSKLDAYAKAFVVEDSDLDTVITFHEIKTALDGVPSVQHITNKQVDYVFKVLHIDDATLITFRMFAVITALCERVTEMDPLSKHLMELCNLADIERKLNLYQAMFYHNIPADRNTNFITSDSLKIELIAGGLNWKQQKYIMEKMEPNDWGEISFIDYMCYIPLFMSMHDNICENPLDMSDTKYQMPPRKRPPSVQRDMNPLGQPLSKNSTFLLKKQARDMVEGKIDKSCLQAEKIQLLEKYAKLPEIPKSRESKKAEDTDEEKMDLIY